MRHSVKQFKLSSSMKSCLTGLDGSDLNEYSKFKKCYSLDPTEYHDYANYIEKSRITCENKCGSNQQCKTNCGKKYQAPPCCFGN